MSRATDHIAPVENEVSLSEGQSDPDLVLSSVMSRVKDATKR